MKWLVIYRFWRVTTVTWHGVSVILAFPNSAYLIWEENLSSVWNLIHFKGHVTEHLGGFARYLLEELSDFGDVFPVGTRSHRRSFILPGGHWSEAKKVSFFHSHDQNLGKFPFFVPSEESSESVASIFVNAEKNWVQGWQKPLGGNYYHYYYDIDILMS